jgi:tagatose-1,6-bisphosphate aldolase non-catalytic subunit AgaZ/GatZ
MTPVDFLRVVAEIANHVGFSRQDLIWVAIMGPGLVKRACQVAMEKPTVFKETAQAGLSRSTGLFNALRR